MQKRIKQIVQQRSAAVIETSPRHKNTNPGDKMWKKNTKNSNQREMV